VCLFPTGFMHRDIKPENVFLDDHRNVLLGDFGLGGKWCSLAPTNATCGSLNYAGMFFFIQKKKKQSSLTNFSTFQLLKFCKRITTLDLKWIYGAAVLFSI